MQVAASGVTGRSGVADHLALGDALTRGYGNRLQVAVPGNHRTAVHNAVVDCHHVAQAPSPAGASDLPGSCGELRRTASGTEVDSVM